MSQDAPMIAIGQLNGALYVALRGRATQRTCPTVEQIVSTFLQAHPSGARVILDFGGAEWVDSTFAGWLIGVLRRAERSEGRLVLGNVSPKCAASLEKMHVASLFTIEMVRPPNDMRSVECEGEELPDAATLQLMLKAHEELAAVDAQNGRVFGPIAAAIRAEVEKSSR